MLRKIVEFIKKIFRMEPIQTTVNTLREALQSLEVARNHFENCDPEFVDAAIFELNAAECRVDAVSGLYDQIINDFLQEHHVTEKERFREWMMYYYVANELSLNQLKTLLKTEWKKILKEFMGDE